MGQRNDDRVCYYVQPYYSWPTTHHHIFMLYSFSSKYPPSGTLIQFLSPVCRRAPTQNINCPILPKMLPDPLDSSTTGLWVQNIPSWVISSPQTLLKCFQGMHHWVSLLLSLYIHCSLAHGHLSTEILWPSMPALHSLRQVAMVIVLTMVIFFLPTPRVTL